MSRFDKIFIVILSMMLSGCNSTHKSSSYIQFMQRDVEVLSGEVAFPQVDLWSPRSLAVCGDQLLVIDRHDRCHVTAISLTDGSAKRVIGEGNGPLEFIRVAGLYPKKETIQVTDDRKRKVGAYKYDSKELFGGTALLETNLLALNEAAYAFVPFRDKYIATGCFGSEQFALVNSDAGIELKFGRYPGDNKSVGTHEFVLKNQTIIRTDPCDSYFVAAGVYNDWLAFYKYDEGRFELLKEYFTSDSNLKTTGVSDDKVARYSTQETSETIRHYRALYATEKYMYALYWGIPSDAMRNADNKCYVYRFNYNGSLDCGYVIDNLLKSFAVTSGDEVMYAVAVSDDEEVLMKYKLDK